jgi:hypothetical protein
VCLLVFHAYINGKHGSKAKPPVKNLVSQNFAEGFNSGVKGLDMKGIATARKIGTNENDTRDSFNEKLEVGAKLREKCSTVERCGIELASEDGNPYRC